MSILTPGSVANLKASDAFSEAVTLKVQQLQEGVNGKYKCQFSDGKENISGILTSQVGKRHGAQLKEDDVVCITEANISSIEDSKVLIVAGMDLVGDREPSSPAPAAPKAEAIKPEAATPAPLSRPAASPYGAPASATPINHPTPPSAGWALRNGGATPRTIQPIGALNPYNNNWAIKAKVVSKGQKRSFTKNGAATSVFSAELVDDRGTSIEATFWREAADRCYAALEEGRVYTLARGAVKPANKKFSSVRNDYTLHFDAGAEVEPCEDDIDVSQMQAKLDPVPIEQLAAFADKKMTVDLLAVVSSVGPLGSVKRKVDAAELARRDVTLVDQGKKTVTLTLWGPTAEGLGAELESRAAQHPVLSVSACRVSAFNGVSVSTLHRSVLSVDPAGPEADALRAWWAGEGSAAPTTHVGEGLSGAAGRSGAQAASNARLSLADIREQGPTSAGVKPVFSSATATVASINPDQSLYYAANPENNRKVVEQGPGQWYCEYSGTTLPSMVRRYILQAKVVDESGECFVQVFNDQAQELLGMSADDLAALKDAEPSRFLATLKAASWKDWALRVKASAQEYNGEQRQRFALAEIKPLDFAAESRRMLSLISGQA
ncbi:RFA3 [Auxenochlorella protothecoides x Auxenochlorella symbiontica]|uniref:Replication protein A subunit n=1 Tax=Auxenochlorella protothecoides TaxID=3075 RepID=A0A1D1ZXJ0_AUXPR